MKTTRTHVFPTAALAGLLLGALLVTAAQAQGPNLPPPPNSEPAAAPGIDTSAPERAPDVPGTATESNWHIDPTFYLWMPGAHGNANAFGYNTGFKASFSDLLSHFDFGVMGAVGVQYKGLVMTSDLLYMALSVTNTKELDMLPGAPTLSAKVKFREVMFTQKIGYRVVDGEKIKVDALTGFRYFHMGTTLTLTPSPFVNNPYASANWADPLVGGRILVPLSPKILATLAGDVGGFGAGAQQDYQIIGALGYKLNPKMTLEAGWRYLYFDKSKGNNFTLQMAESGVILGMVYSLK